MLVSKTKRALTTIAGVALVLSATSAAADYALNLTPGVTPISHEAHTLHMLIMQVCAVIGLIVFGAMFISIIKHRKSRGVKPAQFHESTAVEIVWTIVPFLILVGMAIPATKALVAMEDTSDADLSIKVTGYQWRWGYDYVDDGVNVVAIPRFGGGQVDAVQYRYTPATVNVGYEYGSVETFEYGVSAEAGATTDSGTPQPYVDLSRA